MAVTHPSKLVCSAFNRAARRFFKRAGGETVYDELVAPFFRQNHARLKAAGVAASTLLAFPLAVVSNRLMGDLITRLTADSSAQTIKVLALGGTVALCQIAGGLLTNRLRAKLGNDWQLWATTNCIEHICKDIPPPFLTGTPDNRTQTAENVISDLRNAVWSTLDISTEALSTGANLMAFSYVLNQISSTAFLGTALMTAISVAVPYLWKKKLHKAQEKFIEDATSLHRALTSVERNVEAITFLRGKNKEEANLKKKSTTTAKSRATYIRLGNQNFTWNHSINVIPKWFALLPFINQKNEAGPLSRIIDATSQVLFPVQRFMGGTEQRIGWGVSISRLEKLLTRHHYLDPDARSPQYKEGEEKSVQIENLTIFAKDFGPMCNDVTFTLKPGDRLALTGDPGSGKTTLLRQMAGYMPIFDGTITFTGMNRDKDVIITPQTSYTPQMSLAEALSYPRNCEDFTREQMEDALRKCCLDHKIKLLNDPLDQVHDLQNTLSGGEQQYFNVARILLHRPAFIGLDEPTAAMGPKKAIPLLKTIIEELPDSIIVTSLHDEALIPLHNMNAHIEDKKLTFRPIRRKPNIRGIRLKQIPQSPCVKGP